MRAFIALFLLVGAALADEESHKYSTGDPVLLWLNKVGPYHNPYQTYSYYSLPFCKPTDAEAGVKRASGIGEILSGNELRSSGVDIRFNVDVEHSVLCSSTLSLEQADAFALAVSNHYWYQLFLDDLPIWGMVGEVYDSEEYVREMELHPDIPHSKAAQTLVYVHKSFSVSYNYDRVIQVNLTSENPVIVEAGKELEFSYSVHWVPTTIDFEDRFDRYLDFNFFEHTIHWFSIFNSIMMIIFLVGLVALIMLRTLKADFARYMHDEEDDVGDDSGGWKLCASDVFRRPNHATLLAALLGTGAQLTFGAIGMIGFAVAGELYAERGGIVEAAIVAIALSAGVAGYVSGGYYKRQFYPKPAEHWVRCMLLTIVLLPTIVFGTGFALNAFALYYELMSTVPFVVMLKVLAIWLFVAAPLGIVGTIMGRSLQGQPNSPCRVSVVPRVIPDCDWHSKPLFLILITGILPFGSIYLETFYLLTSIAGYKHYYLFGLLGVVLCILIIVTASVTIVSTYFLLNAENYHWSWTSFLAGASTAVYVFLYAAYFYVFKTHMFGALQAIFFFGYTGMTCVMLGILCGSVGWFAASRFTHVIFRNIKND